MHDLASADKATSFTPPSPPDHLAASLELHARTAANSAQLAAHTIATAYMGGDLSAREALQVLYGWDTLIVNGIKQLERAKEDVRSAMENPAIRVAAPLEIEGRGTVSWVEPTQTISYSAKEITRLTTELASAMQPLPAAMEQLGPLLDQVPHLVANGHLSDDDGTALVEGIQQLALLGQAARTIANELQHVRQDGTKKGYVKVESRRATKAKPAAPTDEPPF